jgi:hypothetical protein
MDLDVIEWGTRPGVGKGYGADVYGKWCSLLETKGGAYRGDHTHPYNQYTVLLGGSARVVKLVDGELIEHPLQENMVHTTPRGVAHILVADEDAVLYEWWDGPYEAEQCPGVFGIYKEDRVGPRG